MKPGRVYFSHGKESGPWGIKITALAKIATAKGFRVESVDYTDLPVPDARAARLVSHCGTENDGPVILVGSSMGGYVATVAAAVVRPAGLFLMAPAFYLPDYAVQDPKPVSTRTVIVHGVNDEVIPMEHSIRFARHHRATLFLVNGDHALIDQLPLLEELFNLFLDSP
jgi:pimeloyl-ACP methyl ester carboxylesterase